MAPEHVTAKMHAVPTVTPVTPDQLQELCIFLHSYLNANIQVPEWERAFRNTWSRTAPNVGFALRNTDGAMVGAIGAIYADRRIRGELIRFCNITSWCVLPEYRRYGMKLAVALVSQPGYQFTVLSPTEVVAKSLQMLGFKAMDDSATVLPAMPGWQPGVRFVDAPHEIDRLLSADDAAIFRDHADYRWLPQAAVGKDEAYCLFAYSLSTLKGLPCADVIFTSNAELFLRYRPTISRVLLLRHGVVGCRIESRLLPWQPRFSLRVPGYYRKIFRGDRVSEGDISNFYSELVTLRQ